MRKMVDLKCNKCEEIQRDRFVDVAEMEPHDCGGYWEKVFLPGHATAVHGDDIPGGIEIHNGLCNPDGSAKKYYSKSEIAREAARRGLVNYVEHKPERGSDKSKHTTRWV